MYFITIITLSYFCPKIKCIYLINPIIAVDRLCFKKDSSVTMWNFHKGGGGGVSPKKGPHTVKILVDFPDSGWRLLLPPPPAAGVHGVIIQIVHCS